MGAYKRGKGYWIDFSFNGKRFRKPSPDTTFKGANAYELLIRQKLARGETLEDPKVVPTFKEFSETWYISHALVNNKPSEQRQKESNLRIHLVPFFGRIQVDQITGLKIEEFKAEKIAEGLSPKTINNHLAVLGTCLKSAEEWLDLNRIPRIKLLKVPPQVFKYLNERDYRKILDLAKETEIYEILLFTLRTGVRIGEAMALEWPDFNFANQTVLIRRSIVNGITGSPKNNKTRSIPLAIDIARILMTRQEKEGLVFTDRSNKPFSRFACRRVLHNICKRADVKIISWHALRHSFASQLATNGVSLMTIQQLLGHSDLKMVQRYAHLEPVTLQAAINTLTPKATYTLDLCHNSVTVPEKTKIKALEN